MYIKKYESSRFLLLEVDTQETEAIFLRYIFFHFSFSFSGAFDRYTPGRLSRGLKAIVFPEIRAFILDA